MRTEALAVLGLLLLLHRDAPAQALRGKLMDERGVPLAGVLIELVDGSRVAARTLSGPGGTFRLASRAGTYRVSARRIGYRPFTSETIALAAGRDLVQEFRIRAVPITLDTIRVTARDRCRGYSDSPRATYALWEQVRTALNTARLTEDMGALDATVLMHEHTIRRLTSRVLETKSSVRQGLTTKIWRSKSADSLRLTGYLIEDPKGTIFFGPDVTVLASDAFLEDHCFKLVQRDSTIGIAFEPSSYRRNDIKGTLWIDRKTSELNRVEFLYANASRVLELAEAGGEMRFLRLPSGEWVIRSWSLRGPGAEAQLVQTVTGELARVARDGAVLWELPGVPVSGTVRFAKSGDAVVGARVVLRGLPYESAVDATGKFQIANAPPGEHVLHVVVPELEILGPVHELALAVTDSVRKLDIRVRSESDLAATLCGSSGGSGGMIVGKLRDANDSTPPWNVGVTTSWKSADGTVRTARVRTDAAGMFKLCGVPRATELEVRADGSQRGATTRVPPGRAIVRLDLIIEP